jgi:hypothetical protein
MVVCVGIHNGSMNKQRWLKHKFIATSPFNLKMTQVLQTLWSTHEPWPTSNEKWTSHMQMLPPSNWDKHHM